MAKRYYQSKADKKDESLGMRRGKESGKKQSYKDRRDESYGMDKRGGKYEKLKDAYAASYVESWESTSDRAMKEQNPGSFKYMKNKEAIELSDQRKIKRQMLDQSGAR